MPQKLEQLMATMTSESSILAQVLYYNQNTLERIGDVICPNWKGRSEKSVYLTSREEINKITYECKQCKPCSYVPKFLLSIRNHVLPTGFTYLVKTMGYCFRKKTNLDYQKKKLSPLMLQCISQSKLSTREADEANIEPAPKIAKLLPYMEKSCHAPIGCFITTKIYLSLQFSNFSQTDNTLFHYQHNAIYSLQQRNTVEFGLWSWFCSFVQKGSRWNPYKQLPGTSAGSLVFVVVPKTKIFWKITWLEFP